MVKRGAIRAVSSGDDHSRTSNWLNARPTQYELRDFTPGSGLMAIRATSLGLLLIRPSPRGRTGSAKPISAPWKRFPRRDARFQESRGKTAKKTAQPTMAKAA